MFKRHRYPKAIILQAVYFKLMFTLSYLDIEEILRIRGVQVDHSTIQRWVYKFSPLLEANMHKRKKQVCDSWRMDETYIKVGVKDRYKHKRFAQGHFRKTEFGFWAWWYSSTCRYWKIKRNPNTIHELPGGAIRIKWPLRANFERD